MTNPPSEWTTVLDATRWVMIFAIVAWIAWTAFRQDIDPVGRSKKMFKSVLIFAIAVIVLTLPDSTTLWGVSVGYFSKFCPDQPALVYPIFLTACSMGIITLSVLLMGFWIFKYRTRAGRIVSKYFRSF